MKATNIFIDKLNTRRKVANRALKAMSDIQEYNNGTISNPCSLASVFMDDGRSLIQTIYEDGCVSYNDGYFIVEVDQYHLYVDVTVKYMNEIVVDNYEIEDYFCVEND